MYCSLTSGMYDAKLSTCIISFNSFKNVMKEILLLSKCLRNMLKFIQLDVAELTIYNLTQLFIKPMTLTMTLNWLLRTHFIPRITDPQRKNKQKDAKVHITANTEEGWLRNQSESRYLYSPYSLLLLFGGFQLSNIDFKLIYYRICTVCKYGLL